MPSRSPDAALLHIRDNIVFARTIVEGLSYEAFEHDRLKFYAVTRCLEIVSEAVRRLSPEILERHPGVPWRVIMDAGNFYRHSYDGVHERIVFATVHESLPELLLVVESEIPRGSGDS
jgi:uncharacterized protein with HEPN domain